MSKYLMLSAKLTKAHDLRERAALLRATQDAWATAVKQWASVVTLTRREVRGGMRWSQAGYPDDDSESKSEVIF